MIIVTACVHPKDGENYLRYMTDEEFQTLRKTEEYKDEYTDMWKTFFHAIVIDERKLFYDYHQIGRAHV